MPHERRPEAVTPFGQWVLSVLDKHKETLRGQRRRTGLAHSTITNWLDGATPGMDAVIAFARGFEEDVNYALELAGYDRIEDTEMKRALDATDALIEGLAALQAEFPGRLIPIPRVPGGSRSLTLDQARSIIQDLREQLRPDTKAFNSHSRPVVVTTKEGR